MKIALFAYSHKPNKYHIAAAEKLGYVLFWNQDLKDIYYLPSQGNFEYIERVYLRLISQMALRENARAIFGRIKPVLIQESYNTRNHNYPEGETIYLYNQSNLLPPIYAIVGEINPNFYL